MRLLQRPGSVAAMLVGPAVVMLGVTSVLPILYALFISLFSWNWGQDFEFVGLANYAAQLGSGRFWRVMLNTAYFTACAVACELFLGFALALAVNRVATGAGTIRTVLLMPLMVSGIVVALMAKILLDPTLGIVGYGLSQLGMTPPAFFGSAATAMPTVILVDTWWQTSFVFVVLLAGLQSLSPEPYEAARVDGASTWQQFRHITLPLLRPLLFVVLIFRTIDCLKVFVIVFGTTGGGPDIATEVAQTYAYRTAFKVLQIGDAMTIVVLFSAIILLVCTLYVRYGPWRAEVAE